MSLEKLRKSMNMTQEQLAIEVGVGRSTVAMWESGESTPRPDKLLKLSEIFGISIEEILKMENEK